MRGPLVSSNLAMQCLFVNNLMTLQWTGRLGSVPSSGGKTRNGSVNCELGGHSSRGELSLPEGDTD